MRLDTGMVSTAQLKQQVFAHHRARTARSKRRVKSTTIAAYTGVFLLIMSLVAIGYQPPQRMDTVASVAATAPTDSTANAAAQPSVDQLVATDVAATIAERADLAVAPNIANLSISLSVEDEMAQTSSNVISKPQIIQPSADNHTIQTYVAKAGDTATSVGAKYGISAQTVKWANDLSSDAIEKGRKLTIPPIDGVVYKVESGDTISSIAKKYDANEETVLHYNDLEMSGLKVGSTIVIPGGNLPTTQRPGYQAPSYTSTYGGGYFVGSFSGASVGNRYAWGNCTWYAYERRVQLGLPVGSFWGNASTWALAAQQNGFRVDNTPSVGAIAQWNAYAGGSGYYGHVGIVEGVNSDGTVTISEMNNYAYGGFGVVDHRTISASSVSNYIH
ncbi:MAG TPA: CHAP domain-containing protein [Candidatus Saccharimonadaceae bacterium]|nr:CHAP domain-containing protein [Candidatus Saccharimonadaceae bacterium]